MPKKYRLQRPFTVGVLTCHFPSPVSRGPLEDSKSQFWCAELEVVFPQCFPTFLGAFRRLFRRQITAPNKALCFTPMRLH
jgi:hypothetical protein